jgi:hypothetical protein
MGLPALRYRHLILLHTQICNGCRCLPSIHEWLAEFRPYTLGYQPRSGKCRVSTQANQKPKSSPVLKSDEGKETRLVTKKRSVMPKYRSISAIQDFSPVLRRFNPYLSDEQKRAMHTQLTQILDEYA